MLLAYSGMPDKLEVKLLHVEPKKLFCSVKLDLDFHVESNVDYSLVFHENKYSYC